jgi:hypothetical protein
LQEEGKDKIARFLATLRDETGKLLPGIKELRIRMVATTLAKLLKKALERVEGCTGTSTVMYTLVDGGRRSFMGRVATCLAQVKHIRVSFRMG